MTSYHDLNQSIQAQETKIGVLGLGYVGLPVALSFAEAGFPVVGVDVDEEKVRALCDGVSPLTDVPDARVRQQTAEESIQFTLSAERLAECGVILICVPTPLRKSRDPDVSFIADAVETVADVMSSPSLVVLESTTYPGTTSDLVVPTFDDAGWSVDEEVFVAFSPERIDPGNHDYNFENTPKVVGGTSDQAGDLAEACYGQVIDDVVRVSDDQTAEMVKLVENTFRSVNIGLANEMALLCDRINVDVWEVVDAAATKPYGFMPFYPGPGLGGHCIPVDPLFLSWKARTLDTSSRFVDLADEINRGMPKHIVEKLFSALNEVEKPLSGSSVILFGVAYKGNVGDTRESPARDIVRRVRNHGADLRFCDPFVDEFTVDGEPVESIQRSELGSSPVDAAVIVTAHDRFDWARDLKNARCVVDSRGVVDESVYEQGPLHRL